MRLLKFYSLQFFILIGVAVLPIFFLQESIKAFGLMLPAGFCRWTWGQLLQSEVYWQRMGWSDATSIGQTFATIGLLGGIFGGVAVHQYWSKKREKQRS